jgi:transcriptional repressor NrdR
MQCPYCKAPEDKVVDSRPVEAGLAVRRRRECLSCRRRFTTYERVEAVALRVRKRSGERVPFDRAKVAGGIQKAFKNRPITEEQIDRMVLGIEEALRAASRLGEVSSQEVGLAVLDRLQETDAVAYLRFASVYENFQDVTDFERAMGALQKKTPPKAVGKPGEEATPRTGAGAASGTGEER